MKLSLSKKTKGGDLIELYTITFDYGYKEHRIHANGELIWDSILYIESARRYYSRFITHYPFPVTHYNTEYDVFVYIDIKTNACFDPYQGFTMRIDRTTSKFIDLNRLGKQGDTIKELVEVSLKKDDNIMYNLARGMICELIQ